MANISLKNFVNIDIQPSVRAEVSGTRETIALLTDEGVANTKDVYTISDYASLSSLTNTTKFLDTYFKNGGVSAYVVQGITYTASAIESAIAELDDKYVVVAFAYSLDGTLDGSEEQITSYNTLKQVAIDRNEDDTIYGINEKVILCRSIENTDTSKVKNLVVKYSNNVGAEMTIGAYLSQINVYGINTIQDYAFTKETFTDAQLENEFVPTDTEFKRIINNNYNVDIELQDDIRNMGGNDKDGDSLMNNWTRIVLQQTLTSRLVELLKSKIRSTDGISKMYATLVDELEYYRVNGYLTTDKVWKADTLVINGITIIEKGTALLTGYQIKIFPMSSLTDEQKRNHQAPPIYIVLADQYSIRVINISGEVI